MKPAGGPRKVRENERSKVQAPPSNLVDDEEADQVRELLDSWRRGGALQYLVDWEGYSPEEWFCVNSRDILYPSLTEEFHRTHHGKPAPRPQGRTRHRLPPCVRSRSQDGGSVTNEAPTLSLSHHQREPSPEY